MKLNCTFKALEQNIHFFEKNNNNEKKQLVHYTAC